MSTTPDILKEHLAAKTKRASLAPSRFNKCVDNYIFALTDMFRSGYESGHLHITNSACADVDESQLAAVVNAEFTPTKLGFIPTPFLMPDNTGRIFKNYPAYRWDLRYEIDKEIYSLPTPPSVKIEFSLVPTGC